MRHGSAPSGPRMHRLFGRLADASSNGRSRRSTGGSSGDVPPCLGTSVFREARLTLRDLQFPETGCVRQCKASFTKHRGVITRDALDNGWTPEHSQSMRRTQGMPWSDLGRRLRRLRVSRQLTQAALAERAGVSRVWVQKLELGAGGMPSLSTLEQLARALGVQLRVGFVARRGRGRHGR